MINIKKEEVFNKLVGIWTQVTGHRPQENSTLKSLGSSSMSYIVIKKKIYDEFGIDIKIIDLYKNKTFHLQFELLLNLLGDTK